MRAVARLDAVSFEADATSMLSADGELRGVIDHLFGNSTEPRSVEALVLR